MNGRGFFLRLAAYALAIGANWGLIGMVKQFDAKWWYPALVAFEASVLTTVLWIPKLARAPR